jgi:Tyosinase C-terminal domain
VWWTSRELRHCRTLGYTYPELVKTNSHPDMLRQWVIDNYEWTTISGDPPPLETVFNTEDLDGVDLFPDRLQVDGRGPPIDIPRERFVYGRGVVDSVGAIPRILGKCFKRSERTSLAQKRYKHLKGLIKDGKLTHWNITVKVKKSVFSQTILLIHASPLSILVNRPSRFALNGSFQVLLFLGDFSSDPCTWHHDARLVGIDAIFASHSLDNCDNCRQQNESGLMDSDVVPLTTPLVAYWRSQEEMGGMRLKNLEVAEVKEFLRRNLHWRVLDVSLFFSSLNSGLS